jgi:hypothetical protein
MKGHVMTMKQKELLLEWNEKSNGINKNLVMQALLWGQ